MIEKVGVHARNLGEEHSLIAERVGAIYLAVAAGVASNCFSEQVGRSRSIRPVALTRQYCCLSIVTIMSAALLMIELGYTYK